ncbi:U3-containing 90S pre-ribosomal complex subunit-domain containing protein [Poronia punctata]|nr:U3-containing 90S pre-ribosomal complex subunit-domain containing protein [Poronia punctata]
MPPPTTTTTNIPSSKPRPKAKPKKRARDETTNDTQQQQQQKAKRRKSAFDQDDLDLDLDAGLNLKIAHLDNMLLADHIAQKTRRFGSDLRPVELGALDISHSSSFSESRTLENFPAFLEAHAPDPKDLEAAPKENGSPHTIVVAGAGLRAADIVRAMRKYQTKKITVGKLFAKHIKIEDAKKFLETHRTGVSVGTPVRLNDLVESGSLKLDKLERLVVDASHIDQKKRGIMDMKETMIPLARWLSRTEFKVRYTDPDHPLQLLFY